MRTIVAQEGITGLWKGNIPAELLYLAYGASQFLAYQQVHLLITKSGLEVPESAKSFIAGATAGGLATTATYPLDLLRTRFAAQGEERVCLLLSHPQGCILLTSPRLGLPIIETLFSSYPPKRRSLRLLPRPRSWRNPNCPAHGPFLHELRTRPPIPLYDS